MLDASAIEFVSLIFSSIACSFMVVLELKLLHLLDTDDFLFFGLFDDFLE